MKDKYETEPIGREIIREIEYNIQNRNRVSNAGDNLPTPKAASAIVAQDQLDTENQFYARGGRLERFIS